MARIMRVYLQARKIKSGYQRPVMLIIDVKDEESIDRALKRYKKKHNRVGIMKELRRRKHFEKPSIKRRTELLKAIYKNSKGLD